MRVSLISLALFTLALPTLAVLPPEAQEAAERDAALALPEVQRMIRERSPITVTREGDIITIQAGDIAVRARIVYLPSDPMIDGPVNFRAECIGAAAVPQTQSVTPVSPAQQTAQEMVALLQSEAVLEHLGGQPIQSIVHLGPQEYRISTLETEVTARVIQEPQSSEPMRVQIVEDFQGQGGVADDAESPAPNP